jgi:hypothetical protein
MPSRRTRCATARERASAVRVQGKAGEDGDTHPAHVRKSCVATGGDQDSHDDHVIADECDAWGEARPLTRGDQVGLAALETADPRGLAVVGDAVRGPATDERTGSSATLTRRNPSSSSGVGVAEDQRDIDLALRRSRNASVGWTSTRLSSIPGCLAARVRLPSARSCSAPTGTLQDARARPATRSVLLARWTPTRLGRLAVSLVWAVLSGPASRDWSAACRRDGMRYARVRRT